MVRQLLPGGPGAGQHRQPLRRIGRHPGRQPGPQRTLAALGDFSDQAGASYGFAHDSDGALAGALKVRALDSTMVVDAAGRIVYRDGYPTDEASLLAALRKAGLG